MVGISGTTPRRTRLAALVVVVVMAVFLAGCSGQTSGTAGGTASSGAVQHFDVSLSSGTYVPAELTAKAGVPVQITFGQGQGCVGTLVFPSFNLRADLTQGPKTIDLGVLQPGDYPWACGMNMKHGVLHVK